MTFLPCYGPDTSRGSRNISGLAKRAQNEAEGAATVTAGREDGFIRRHELWTDAQREAADQIRQTLDEGDIRQVRIGWGDQHGIMRGKSLTVPEFRRSLADGKDFQLVTTIFDTTNHPIVSPFAAGNFPGVPELTGLPDGILVPDPTTFRRLPWVDGAASVLSDAYFQNGKPVPFSTRGLLRGQLDQLAAEGYELVVGLEIELYIMRLLDPMLSPEACGWLPSRTNGDPARSSSRSSRKRRWRRPTARCCCGPLSSRSAAASATTPRSWHVPRSRNSSRADGTCTSRCVSPGPRGTRSRIPTGRRTSPRRA